VVIEQFQQTVAPVVPAIRVLSVIPGEPDGASMVFAKRGVRAVHDLGAKGETFYLASRTSPLRILAEWRRLRVVIRETRPDLIHAHYGTLTGLLCALSCTRPLVITFRGIDLNSTRGVPRIRLALGHLCSNLAALRAARIICVTEELRGCLWWRKGRVSVIPSGVDTGLFFPRPRHVARAELGWLPDERIVLFNASRFPKRKRLGLARAAVEHARGRCGAIRLVEMNGYVAPERVPLLMNAADCLLLASDSEGSPNVVREAMACGLPVVSVAVGDVPDLLRGVAPSRIAGATAGELGAAIAEILTHGERSNGSARQAELSLEAHGQEVLGVYRKALGR
jgi:teichuronic acid biosynthesis glycosyltransferase TuaC